MGEAGDDGAWPSVTAVVPTRGRPELVRRTVEAVVAQRYAGSITCLVVHDREEPDPSLAGLAREGRDVCVLVNDGDPGLAGARNRGLREVGTPFVASCDDDDRWLPDKVHRQVQRLRASPELHVVGAGIRLLMPGGRVVERLGASDLVTHGQLLRARHKELHSSTLLMRTGVFDLVGPYDVALPHSYAEDYEWLLRASRLGPLGVVREPLALIAKDGTSYYRERAEVVAAALAHLLATHPELTASRRGHARILGQIAVAHAGLREREQALRWARASLARWPLAPQALLALLQLATGADPRVLLRSARLVGRGLS